MRCSSAPRGKTGGGPDGRRASVSGVRDGGSIRCRSRTRNREVRTLTTVAAVGTARIQEFSNLTPVVPG
ncbi:hypothetical protein Stsp01_47230 [Streptomyces sp. NBRC 13847]|nr:hypothetical protein Stsp01_47230 [Streptomyces sp. NBRC 13847]